MSVDTSIPTVSADVTKLQRSPASPSCMGVVRVYNSRPFTVSVQVRGLHANTPMIAHANLTVEQAKALIAALNDAIAAV